MELFELKNQILENTLELEFMIFQCTKNSFFLAEQYIKTFSEKKNLELNYISALESASPENFIFDADSLNRLNILKIDVFSEPSDDYSVYKNCIILCEKIDKKISDTTKEYVINFPEPQDWQVVDFIQTLCTNLSEDEAKWLYTAADKNLYRIENEANKIQVFSGNEQKEFLSYLRFDPSTDLYNLGSFDISNWLLDRNYQELYNFFIHESATNLEVVGIINMLISAVKDNIFVKYGNISLEEFGADRSKKYNYIKYNVRQSENFLLKLLNMLTELDLKIRSGVLDIPKESAIDYLICKILFLV